MPDLPEQDDHAGMRLLRAATYFPVRDVAASVAHYEQVLGFSRVYSAGDPPQFAICRRDALTVMFRLVESAEKITPVEAQGGTWDAFAWTEDADALHRTLVAAGATVVYGPVIQHHYHMKEFAVRDIDGHVLGFGSEL